VKTTDAPKLYQYLGMNTQGDIGPYTMYTAKDRRLVIYLRSPPKKPASPSQIHQRNLFKIVAMQWWALAPGDRAAWNAAAIRARLRITGYNLFAYALLTRDTAAVATVSALAHIPLAPP
jgi:hypothetical protein